MPWSHPKESCSRVLRQTGSSLPPPPVGLNRNTRYRLTDAPTPFFPMVSPCRCGWLNAFAPRCISAEAIVSLSILRSGVGQTGVPAHATPDRSIHLVFSSIQAIRYSQHGRHICCSSSSYRAATVKGDCAMTFMMLLFVTLNVVGAILVLNNMWPDHK